MVDASILEKLKQAALRRSQKKHGTLSFSQDSMMSTQPVSQASLAIPMSQIPPSAQRMSLVSRSVMTLIDTAEMGTATEKLTRALKVVLPIVCIEPSTIGGCEMSVQTEAPYPADMPPVEPAEDFLACTDIVLLLSEILSIVSLYPKPPTFESKPPCSPPPGVTDDVDEDAILELFIRNDEQRSPKVNFDRTAAAVLQDSPPSTPQMQDVWESIYYAPSEILLERKGAKQKHKKRKLSIRRPEVNLNQIPSTIDFLEISPPLEDQLRRSSRIKNCCSNDVKNPPVESLLKRLKHVVQLAS